MTQTRCELALIFGLSTLFLFVTLGATTFLDPDEGMYGSIAREMADTKDWVAPRFNGVVYLDKPPLFFWLSSLTIALFGPSEWAVRLWSALPAFATVLLVWRMGRLLYGDRGGLFSALVMVSSVGVFHYARIVATDFLLVFSVTLAMYGFVRAILANGEWRMANGGLLAIRYSLFATGPLLFWLGMALGVLSKGLIGLVFPLMIVGLYGLVNSQWSIVNGRLRSSTYKVQRQSLNVKTIFSPAGLLLFLGLTLPWHVLAAWRIPDFLEFSFLENQLFRFLGRRTVIEDDVPVGTVAFLILTLIWFSPWSLFLPASLRQGFPGLSAASSVQERLRLVVGLWALVVLGFFSLSSSKLEHYFLPAVPALSLMVGGLWAQVVVKRQSPLVIGHWSTVISRWMNWSFAIGALGCLVVGLALWFYSDWVTPAQVLAALAEVNVYYRILLEQGAAFPFASVGPFLDWLKALGLALGIVLPAAFFLFYKAAFKSSFAALLGLAAIIHVLVVRLDLLVEPHHSARPVAEALRSVAAPGDLVVHYGPLEYSGALPFYTGMKIYVLNGARGSMSFGSRHVEARSLFLGPEQFKQMWEEPERAFLVARMEMNGSEIGNFGLRNVFSLGQFGSHRLYSNQPAR